MDLNGKIRRVKFKRWIQLEELRDTFIRAAEDSADDFPAKLFAYLSAALEVDTEDVKNLPWVDCIQIFYTVYNLNLPSSILPLVAETPKNNKNIKLAWDYQGRNWYVYSHILAHAYGWKLDYISELEIDDALALLQEILTEQQLDKEFLWGLSETAYPYDKATKKNRFVPMPRPYWMLPEAPPIKMMKIRKSMMPQGLVINLEKEKSTDTGSSNSTDSKLGRNVGGL